MPDFAKPEIRAALIEGNIKLTGNLDDPRWKTAQAVTLDYELQPGENTPAPQKTIARVLYNAEYVYFGFDCRDTIRRRYAPTSATGTRYSTTTLSA